MSTTPTYDLAAIHAALPGYQEAQATLAALEQLPMPTVTSHSPSTYVCDAILTAVGEGREPDVQAAAQAAVNLHQAVELGRAALIDARRGQQRRMADIVERHADDVFAAMHDGLTAIIDAVRRIPDRAQLTSIEAAFDLGRVEDWALLSGLLGQYATLRHDQVAILRNRNGSQLPTRVEAVFSPDLWTAYQLWSAWRDHGYLYASDGGENVVLRAPWPHDTGQDATGRATFLSDASVGDFLLWAIDNDLTLWVPTSSQITAAQHAYATQLRRPQTEIPGLGIDPGQAEIALAHLHRSFATVRFAEDNLTASR